MFSVEQMDILIAQRIPKYINTTIAKRRVVTKFQVIVTEDERQKNHHQGDLSALKKMTSSISKVKQD